MDSHYLSLSLPHIHIYPNPRLKRQDTNIKLKIPPKLKIQF